MESEEVEGRGVCYKEGCGRVDMLVVGESGRLDEARDGGRCV